MAAAVAEAQCLVMGSSRLPAQAVLRTAEEQGKTNTPTISFTIHQSIVSLSRTYRAQTDD